MLQVKEQITKLAKKGSTPSQIGVVLRDSHGIAQVRRPAWHPSCIHGRAPQLPARSRHTHGDLKLWRMCACSSRTIAGSQLEPLLTVCVAAGGVVWHLICGMAAFLRACAPPARWAR